MKILVTGGAGFIGSHIVDAYVEQGHTVVVFDNLSTGKQEFVHPDAQLIVGDIATDALDALMERERFDVVNHHAAHMELRVSVDKPVYDANVNVLGSVRLLDAARRTGVSHVILASSVAVLGNQIQFPADEHHPTAPISPYGAGKLAMEHYAHVYRTIHKLNITSLRYTNVYGPRQNPDGESGVIAIFLQKFLQGAQAIIHGDGEQTRDYIYVDDVVSANIIALDYRPNGTYFIANATDISVNTVVAMLQSQLDKPCHVKNGPAKEGDPTRVTCSGNKYASHTGWKPAVSFHDGIRSTVQWFLDHSRTPNTK